MITVCVTLPAFTFCESYTLKAVLWMKPNPWDCSFARKLNLDTGSACSVYTAAWSVLPSVCTTWSVLPRQCIQPGLSCHVNVYNLVCPATSMYATWSVLPRQCIQPGLSCHVNVYNLVCPAISVYSLVRPAMSRRHMFAEIFQCPRRRNLCLR